jgi:very-short-patch-repair endonuclease
VSWHNAFDESGARVLSRAELRARGATGSSLTAAVRSGFLLRVRRDHYALPDCDQHVVEAVRIGGRLGCISALADAGAFVVDSSFTHAHLDPLASRSRSPHDRFVPLSHENRDGVEIHWTNLMDERDGDECRIGLRDALLQSLSCQSSWNSVATFDSALHLGLVTSTDVSAVFARAPKRAQRVARLIDARAESGPESILRMIVTSAGFHCVPQVTIAGVGRVDLVVEDRLVLEADSRAWHQGWEKQRADRARDIELAKQRYLSLRPVSDHILYSPQSVRDAIEGLLAVSHRR